MSDLKAKLEEQNKQKLQEATVKVAEQKKERRARTVKGSHLTETFLELARDAKCNLRANNSFHVITGAAGKSLRIYVAIRGGIVDLLGFSVNDPAVTQISAEVAKEKHMGRVQGRLDLEKPDADVIAAYKRALEVLNTPLPEKEKAPKKERKPKAEKVAGEQPTQP